MTRGIINSEKQKNQRRNLRTNGTKEEATLWNLLKNKKLCGLQFRRQYSIGRYILDFYCPKLKLAIELDGLSHHLEQNEQHDILRDTNLLNQEGIKVIRFANNIVTQYPELITNAIIAELDLQTENKPIP